MLHVGKFGLGKRSIRFNHGEPGIPRLEKPIRNLNRMLLMN